MTQTYSSTPSRGLQILKTALYILAGIILALGLVTGISLAAGANAVAANMALPMQLMGGPVIGNLIMPLLSSFLINLGLGTLLLSLVLSALLYAAGRLVGWVIVLEARLAALEARA